MDDVPLAEPIDRVLARPGTKIYCAMGSSGTPELLKRVVAILRGVPDFNVVCATTTILDPEDLGAPDARFAAVRYLPAHAVCERVDLLVAHGGQGTVQTAVWAGIPVVGIGLQWEQQANLDGLARAGAGIRVPLHSVTSDRLLTAVRRALAPSFKASTMQLRERVRSSDGAGSAVQMMRAFVTQRAEQWRIA
jgi:UDP:flavonoid glycosyltransferase YjiC (YdhE family)